MLRIKFGIVHRAAANICWEIEGRMKLTKNELIWIDDHITLLRGTDGEGLMSGLPMEENFIVKLGGALLIALDSGENEVFIGYEEALCLREICQSTASIGQEKVGMSLKRKMHERLQEIEDFPYKLATEFVDRRRDDANRSTSQDETYYSPEG